MKRVAILQSNYIPWKGYFDLLGSVDEFILYDDVQYTRRDWRNRNRIKTPSGTIWLTVPVDTKGKYDQRICDTKIQGQDWAEKHRRSLEANYAKSQFFEEVSELLFPLYDNRYTMLSELNAQFISAICNYLDIKTRIQSSLSYPAEGAKSDRLIDICTQANADLYLSGPSAKNYLDEEKFQQAGINVEWFDYNGYPEYNQLWGEFVHEVSIIDVLFNCGPEAKKIAMRQT